MSRVRADKLLANLGYGSRKEVGGAIRRGVLRVGGNYIRDPSTNITFKDIETLGAFYDQQPLDPLPPLTVLLNKPRGFTCSHDEEGLLVYDLLPERWRYRTPVLSTAGRLDKESTGLALLTDDGQLLHKIISPKAHVSKQYHVTLRDKLKGTEQALFISGEMALDDKPLKPAFWQPDGEKSGIMTLSEGRYHQIRRMFKALGNEVSELHRYKIGGLELGDIQPGEYRILNKDDINRIFEAGA